MTTTTPINTKSIKAILEACAAFETALGHDVLDRRLESNLRDAFEREARANLGGVETRADLRQCDTVGDMMLAITAAAGGDVKTTRIHELVRALRLDTEKLYGDFYFGGLCEAINALGNDPGARLDYLQAPMNTKGVCLKTTPCDYALVGYHQKDALNVLANLLALLGHPRKGDSVFGVEDFEAAFPGAKVTVYKNGNIVVKGLGYGNTRLAEAVLSYLTAWEKGA